MAQFGLGASHHHSITPSLHHSITPSLHHSITPSLHHSARPDSRTRTTTRTRTKRLGVADTVPNPFVSNRETHFVDFDFGSETAGQAAITIRAFAQSFIRLARMHNLQAREADPSSRDLFQLSDS